MTTIDLSNYPRVTSVLHSAGLVDTAFYTEAGRERGTDVHAACQYLDEGALDEESVPLDVAVRLNQYQRFKADMGDRLAIRSIEQLVVHHGMRYVGHPDRIVTLDGRTGILDLKGPGVAQWMALQLIAYAKAAGVAARWSLHLSDTKYQLHEWSVNEAALDWSAFCAAISLHNWKVRKGVAA